MHSTIKNHPFVDGNKRTALAATRLDLEPTGHKLAAGNRAVLEFTRHVAIGANGPGAIARWMEEISQPTEDDPKAKPSGRPETWKLAFYRICQQSLCD